MEGALERERAPPPYQAGPPPNQAEPPPNQAGPPPNQAGPPPNQAGPPPNQAEPPPNQAGPPPNQAGPPPNQAGPPPNQAEIPPNQAGPPPNQAGPPPNQAEPPPYQAGPPPNQAGPPPNQAEIPPNQAGPPPNQAGPPPNQAEPPPYQAGPPHNQAGPPHNQAEPPPYQAGPPPYQAEPPPYQAEPPPYQAEPPPYESLPLPTPPSFSTAISEAHRDSLSYFSSVTTPTGQNPGDPLSYPELWTGEHPPGSCEPYWITVELPQPRVPLPGSVTEDTRSRCQQLTSLEFSQEETGIPSPGSLVEQTSPSSFNETSLEMSDGIRDKPSSCLPCSIMNFFLCPVLGFVAIILSITVKVNYRRGHFAKAHKYSCCQMLLSQRKYRQRRKISQACDLLKYCYYGGWNSIFNTINYTSVYFSIQITCHLCSKTLSSSSSLSLLD
ncbi:pollen-specific leucine-rich repeat extensin-like protein 1 isoform X1 [Rana temporaria]|uniref:pollen-specific leucine-rich repeat extensin-like protein 1 isoform X1 n=1 Tax=Rana temporaria TaxID=8407 RepID=UPI001AADD16C|nr:pollen-specific leucine-rich repeat extensin-like protein 1 isoform X1 [Rana temporaria]